MTHSLFPHAADWRPPMYFCCKLTQADHAWLDQFHAVIQRLNEPFEIMPFAYDFKNYCPTGDDPSLVLDHDLTKVESASVVVVLVNGDTSDGRGMEIMHRVHQSDEKRQRTLILKAKDRPISAMYFGFPQKFGVPIVEFDSLDQVPQIVVGWYQGLTGETLPTGVQVAAA